MCVCVVCNLSVCVNVCVNAWLFSRGADNCFVEAAQALPALKVGVLEVHTADVRLETVPWLFHLEIQVPVCVCVCVCVSD